MFILKFEPDVGNPFKFYSKNKHTNDDSEYRKDSLLNDDIFSINRILKENFNYFITDNRNYKILSLLPDRVFFHPNTFQRTFTA
jgi:hypothetical protein